MKVRKTICIAAMVMMASLLSFSGIMITRYLMEKYRVQKEYDLLSSMTDSYGKDPEEGSSEEDLKEAYRKLKEINPDYVGWLRIDGTKVDYPVVQSDENEGAEFYLDHGFDREYSVYGVPFLDVACDMEKSNNLIIYGHRMTDRSMFHEVADYTDWEFWKEHKDITFITETEEKTYEVISAFLYDTDHESFRFRQYTDMDMKAFAQFMKEVHERELYDTGVDAHYGDNLITLSTCDYSYVNGRFVLIAREVR